MNKKTKNNWNFQISWNEIKKLSKGKLICWPSLKTIIIERQRFNWFISEFSTGWKPLSIQVILNGTEKAEVLREFPPNCEVGWIENSGFYQIGPAHDQIQMISNKKEDVFV